MPNNDRIPLPDLDENGSNYNLCYLSLTDFIYTKKISYLIDANFIPPAPGTPEYDTYRTNYGQMRMLVIKSLPKNFESQLEISVDTTPKQLIDGIKNVFTTGSAADHQLLKQEAESTVLTTDTNIEDYLEKHRVLRTKMRLAGFPNITADENITIQRHQMDTVFSSPRYC